MALVLTKLVRSNYDELDNIPIIHQDLTASFTKQADTYYIHTGSTTSAYTKGRMYYCDGTNLKKVVIVDELPKVNDGKLTITVNGTAHTFTANQSGDTSFSITDTHYTNYLQIKGNNTEAVKFTQNADKTLNFKPGANVSISATSGEITISSTDTNTATAADNILDGSNSGTQITYAPYTSQQSKLSFDTSTTNPTRTDRLNLNGYLYATKLYSGGKEVLTSHQDISGKANLKDGNTFTGKQLFNNTINGVTNQLALNETQWDIFTCRDLTSPTTKTAIGKGYVWCQDSDAIYSQFKATGIYYGNDTSGYEGTLKFPTNISGEKTIATTSDIPTFSYNSSTKILTIS